MTSIRDIYSLGHILLGFDQQLDEIARQPAVGVVEERRGNAEVTHAACTSDTMHVFFHVRRQVEIDHVTHVWYIQTWKRVGRFYQI